jgi:Arc/MetJ-type ribon-helix-helix transcriptional regulator
MRQISLNIPEPYLDLLDDLVRQEMYPNRAEAIRTSIRDLLIEHKVWRKEDAIILL